MLNRRSFLLGATSLTLSSLITGCEEKNSSKILLLQGSIPPQLIFSFRKNFSESKNLILKPEINLEELFTLLETWQGKNSQPKEESKFTLPSFNFFKKKAKASELITLGNYWLNQAINEELIEPMSLEKLELWNQLPLKFRDLVRRNEQGNLDEKGKIWAAPYRWGCTMIAYDADKFKALNWTPTDWSDLWREEIKSQFSLLNHPREVIGLTLKKLGYSYNSTDLKQIPNLKSELIALNKQVKFYASTNYLEPLILGDTLLAIGWSSDILPIIKNYPNIKGIIPMSGTSLWADLWAKPKNSQNINIDIINNWINFCWEAQSANQISLFSNASSPLLFTIKQEDIAKDIINNKLKYPDSKIIDKSDFILPLDENINQKYQQLWQEIRNS